MRHFEENGEAVVDGIVGRIIDITLNNKNWYKEKNYWSCTKENIILQLRSKNIPVEILYYNCLENTDRVLQEIVYNRLERWLYPTKTLSETDLSLIGVKIQKIYFKNYNEVKRIIKELTKQHHIVMLYGDAYYLPYRLNDYNRRHILRTMAIVDILNHHNNGYVYRVLSNNGNSHVYRLFNVAESNIESSLNLVPEEWRYIFFCDSSEVSETLSRWEEVKELFHNKFKEELLKVTDTFEIYDVLSDVVSRERDDFIKSDKVTQFEMAMAFLSSSRYLLHQYFQKNTVPKTLWDTCSKTLSEISCLLIHCSNQLDLIRKLIIKASITKRLNISKIQMMCAELKTMEKEIRLKLLKHCL